MKTAQRPGQADRLQPRAAGQPARHGEGKVLSTPSRFFEDPHPEMLKVNRVKIVVSPAQSGERLDQVVAERLKARGVTRAKVQAWIKAGQVRVDGLVCPRPSLRLAGGETLFADIPASGNALRPEAKDVSVVFQDGRLAVLDKPAGLAVHPAPGLDRGTLVHRLLHRFPALRLLDGARPGIVHRLDKDTTGLMAIALDEGTRVKMAEDFAARRVVKTYLAMVHGLPANPRGVIDAPVGRHPSIKTRMAVLPKGGKPAHSDYQVLWADPLGRFSLLKIGIRTGRTHQIRVHMQHLGHPLLGDPVYSASGLDTAYQACPAARPWLKKLLRRPMLHAWRLALPHPETGRRLRFMIPPPRDFWRVPLACSRQVQRVGLIGLPGCGKSLLLAKLSELGLPAWSADAAVRELYLPGRDGWELLYRRFGERFVPDFAAPVDTAALLAAMRESPALRREVEEMVHPLAAHRLEAFWAEHTASRAALAEVPLLLESGWKQGVDLLVGLFCPETLRRSWLETERGWDARLQTDVESWQWSARGKLQACDLVLENPGDPAGMKRRAQALGRVLLWLRRSERRALMHTLADLFARED